MKTFMIPTDFSANATHAAEYGYNLAKQIKANIILCNAVIVPAELPQAGLVVWPSDEYDMLMDESSSELRMLKSRLEANETSGVIKPAIALISKAGMVSDVVNGIAQTQQIDLKIIGPHTNNGLSGFVLGNHARKIIDNALVPIMLVPKEAQLKPIKNIAFATDFTNPAEDLEYIYKLIEFARPIGAEILLTHVYNENTENSDFLNRVNQLVLQLSNKANYPHVYYRLIKNKQTEKGLAWLCENGNIDILAMVHRKHNFLSFLVSGSHTHKMADNISIPLLVFPSK